MGNGLNNETAWRPFLLLRCRNVPKLQRTGRLTSNSPRSFVVALYSKRTWTKVGSVGPWKKGGHRQCRARQRNMYHTPAGSLLPTATYDDNNILRNSIPCEWHKCVAPPFYSGLESRLVHRKHGNGTGDFVAPKPLPPACAARKLAGWILRCNLVLHRVLRWWCIKS